MHYRFVIGQLGLLLIVLGLFMLAIAAWSGFEYFVLDDQSEFHSFKALAAAGLIGLLVGAVPKWLTSADEGSLGRREALLLVAISWIVGAALSGVPYFLWSQFAEVNTPADLAFASPVNCYFEAMSGLTTTGATILQHIEDLPRSLLLWRSLTHWLGGLGIVVLFVAVLPSVGAGGKKLFRVESPGPQPEGIRPHIASTARILWILYLSLTVLEFIALMIAGMTPFDSICHTFATLATGGFSTRNASIAAFDSVAVETVIILFMLLAGVNFGLYYQMIRGRLRDAIHDPEFRLYLLIIIGASLFVVLALVEEHIVSTANTMTEPSVGSAIRHGVFQVVSIITTTGFCTADFDRWGFFPKAVLLGLMFIGASAGSTGGGIKVIRILMMFRVLILEIERVFRPNVVRPLRVGNAVVDDNLRRQTLAYIVGIFLIFITGALLIMAFETGNTALLEAGKQIDFTTAASASAATLNNIGPGLALVGAVENFSWFTDPSKIAMSVLMVVGRLEIFAIVVLFFPRFWRND